MIRVRVAVSPRPYEALIQGGLLAQAGEQLREWSGGTPALFVITVPVLRRRWGKPLIESLSGAGFRVRWLEMPDGEPCKTLPTVERLAEKLARLDADRDAVIVAFGGGVVGDVAGLVASLYMRGVRVVQVPTTVLGQVDASIGGKTGVNLPAGKNLVGTFHQPLGVLVDPRVLSSLPERQFRAGLYEALKCGVIGKPELFERLERADWKVLRRDPEGLEWVIAESIRLKADVVSRDERESGLRRVLNFGHTIGHALEAESRYRRFLHGEAIAWGMIAAAQIAKEMGVCPPATSQRIGDAVLRAGSLPKVEVRSRNILARLARDKKTRNGVVHFVLPRELGKVEIVDHVPESLVLAAVDELHRLSKRQITDGRGVDVPE
ncbi:MAG TPA: 3-dehydroquinate synthase [Terriglobales bacterium]|nr:3-dehydroquinate synthase [Terriglobales bacterium]